MLRRRYERGLLYASSIVRCYKCGLGKMSGPQSHHASDRSDKNCDNDRADKLPTGNPLHRADRQADPVDRVWPGSMSAPHLAGHPTKGSSRPVA